jgi:hypothetical protein
MIVRRYGSMVHSVVPAFDSRAMTEIGFQRTADLSLTSEQFLELYERVGERALTANSEGDVKDEAERAVLEALRLQIEALEKEVGPDALLLVESQPGRDYPKTRDKTQTVLGPIENRLHFTWTIDPPLRLGIFRRKAA